MPSITLPDPKDGKPVELEIPDDPRWHQSTDTPGQWRYEAIDIWGHRVSFAPDSYISAAVAVCWFDSRMRHEREIRDRYTPQSYAWLIHNTNAQDFDDRANAWRKFTARPEGK